MEEKKAILMVSFGTSHLDTLEKAIGGMERDIAEQFPAYRMYRAFTSQMILKKLKETEDLHFYNVKEALEQMTADGMEQVIVQPTHIINGLENDRMLECVRLYAGAFRKLSVGSPLLTGVEDYKKAVHAVMEEAGPEEGEALLLMGHGSDHHGNAAYPALEYMFHQQGYSQVFVGTVEGFPAFENVVEKLKKSGKRKVLLMPFLVVAGDHAKHDMAGDGESWKSKLEDAGYRVRVRMQGLGELKGIRRLFAEHIRAALPYPPV